VRRTLSESYERRCDECGKPANMTVVRAMCKPCSRCAVGSMRQRGADEAIAAIMRLVSSMRDRCLEHAEAHKYEGSPEGLRGYYGAEVLNELRGRIERREHLRKETK